MRKDLDRNTLKMREIQVGFELESITHVVQCLDLFQSQRKFVEILTAQLIEVRDDPAMERAIAAKCNAFAGLMSATNQQMDRLLRMAGIPVPARGRIGRASSNGMPVLDLPENFDVDTKVDVPQPEKPVNGTASNPFDVPIAA
ncbi:MAG TPA: hypothetical protein VN638_06370 [Nitrospiraceae bacterium]|nr:hypothetical protein [Nitrospiraceae bacterium]